LRTLAPVEFQTLTRSPAASASEAVITAVSAPMPTGIIVLSMRPVESSATILPASPAPAEAWFETFSVIVPALL
jgi:hypothetical protein